MSCLQGEVAFMSAYAIHQLHVFIFVLAVFHILYCIITLALGTTKVLNSLAFSKDLNSSLNRFC
jgi:mlo protein